MPQRLARGGEDGMSAQAGRETQTIIAMLRAGAVAMPELTAATGLKRKQVQNRLYSLISSGAAQRAAKWREIDGKRCALYVSTDAASPPPAPHRPRRGGSMRPCLGCGKPFRSEGPHNRLCYDCKRKGADVSPFTPDL